MKFLRNYFSIFSLTYVLLVVTKLVFLFTYSHRFDSYASADLLYAVFWGCRFDFAVSAIVSLIATLFCFSARTLYLSAAVLPASIVILQLSDILYFNVASRHIGYEITDVFNDASGLFMTALSQNTLFTVFSLLLFPLMVWGFYRMASRWLHPIPLNRYYFPKTLILIFISVFFIRGMLAQIPLTPWQSSQIGDERLSILALNGSYNAIFSLFIASGKLQPHHMVRVDQPDIRKAFSNIYDEGRTIASSYANSRIVSSKSQRPNVIFFFLESWSGADIKSYGNKTQTTPFLDDILTKSLRPKAAIAGGHRTTEGMFATLASYQNPLGRTIANTQLENYQYRTVIDLFNQHGYRSIFFQGTYKETSGTGALAQALGFQESYGKADVKKRRYGSNNWGVYDQDLYAFALQKISESKQPFVIGINGATTHDDQIPAGVKMIQFVPEKERNLRLNAMHFADAALGKFFSAIKQRYPNTLFVFFADHCGAGLTGSFKNYMIPLAFYGAGVKARYIDHYVSQRDIAPTVVDIVFGNYKLIMPDFTGKSLISDHHFVADYYQNGVLGWIENMTAIEFSLDGGAVHCYDVSNFRAVAKTCVDNNSALKEQGLAFTNVSQRLLFAGETDQFHTYRYASNKRLLSLSGTKSTNPLVPVSIR